VQETGKVEDMIATLAERGLTIIMVTHRLDQVFRLSTRVAVLRRGRLVGVRRTSETNGDEVVKMITGLAELSHEDWA
jgi:simple sugar transport system ATP-binding protein